MTALLILLPAASQAAPILGQLSISGTIRIWAGTFDFEPPGGGTGQFSVDSVNQTGDFVPLAGTTGTAMDLSSAIAPVGVPVSLPDFLVFAADSDIRFRFTLLDSGVFSQAECSAPPAAGQTCTPPSAPSSLMSALNLTNESESSSRLTFTMHGTVLNTATAETSQFVGTLGTQFPFFSYQTFLGVISSGGSVTASFSALFDVTPMPILISSDGFESGDTGAWSVVAP